VRRVLADLLDAVLPATCVACGSPGVAVCAGCAATARPAPAGPCPPGADWIGAAYVYEGAVREAIARAKYRDHRAVVSWLARGIDGVFPEWCEFDVVTWAPASAARTRARGFDHAQLLARAVGRRRDLPVRRLLARAPGPAQTGRGAAERRAGPRLIPAGSAPPSVLLVDDVVTTGATASAAARALRRAGAGFVAVATAARTIRHG